MALSTRIPGSSASSSKMQKKGWKCWAKLVTSVKVPAKNGYDFEGSFLQAGTTTDQAGETAVTPQRAEWFANHHDHLSFCFTLEKYPRPADRSQYEGSQSLWSALNGRIIDHEQAAALAAPAHERRIVHASRWILHYENRLAYERAMLGESGGIASDRTKPEKGGACRCWASRNGGWSTIIKVNKVSVTILRNFGSGGRDFNQMMPFDKLQGMMSKAEVDAARAAGRLADEKPSGFILLDSAPDDRPARAPKQEPAPDAAKFEAMRDSLAAGVAVVSAPQLFPTPASLARRMVELCGMMSGQRVLEPSAGTGRIVDAVANNATGFDCFKLVAVEVNAQLARGLEESRAKWLYANEDNYRIVCGDFLEQTPETLGTFGKIVMNPPFENADDIRHIRHAVKFLKPGGRLVSVCANGPRQRDAFKDSAEDYIELDAGTFAESGTMVNAALVVIDKGEA